MPKKSAATNLIRRSAGEIPPATPAHLAHLLSAMDCPINTSDIPKSAGTTRRVQRDAQGQLPKGRVSPIRTAILGVLGKHGMTRYVLWKRARVHCPTLPESAVYEFLRGQREIGLPYAEALMRAAGLRVIYRETAQRSRPGPKPPARPAKPAPAAKVAPAPKALPKATRKKPIKVPVS